MTSKPEISDGLRKLIGDRDKIEKGVHEKETADLRRVLRPFIEGFNYDPGHGDLDNEQPIHITVMLGDWRAARSVLASMELVRKQKL